MRLFFELKSKRTIIVFLFSLHFFPQSSFSTEVIIRPNSFSDQMNDVLKELLSLVDNDLDEDSEHDLSPRQEFLARKYFSLWYRPVQSRAIQIMKELEEDKKDFYLPRHYSDEDYNTLLQIKSDSRLFANMRLIQSGGFGTAYLIHQKDEKFVAKIFHDKFDKQQLSFYLANELAALEQIPKHPNIIKYFGSIKRGKRWLLIFEAANKKDLLTTISERSSKFKAPCVRQQFKIAKAVQSLHHRGLAHGDIKSENILITDQTDAPNLLKLADFGSTNSVKKDPLNFIITYRFAGPEHILKKFWEHFIEEHNLCEQAKSEQIERLQSFERIKVWDKDEKRYIFNINLLESVFPDYRSIGPDMKINFLQQFLENYDPRINDIFSLGKTMLEINSSGISLEFKTLLKKMTCINYRDRPDIDSVLAEMAEIPELKE